MVTTNTSTLNSHLNIRVPDCLKFRMDSMVETSSSRKLLLNTLGTKFSDLKVINDDKFWDGKAYTPIEFNADDFYDVDDIEYVKLPVKLNTDRRLTLRPKMGGYLIDNTPMNDGQIQCLLSNTDAAPTTGNSVSPVVVLNVTDSSKYTDLQIIFSFFPFPT